MKRVYIENDWGEALRADKIDDNDINGIFEVELEVEWAMLQADFFPADLARFAAQIANAMPDEFQAALDALNEEG